MQLTVNLEALTKKLEERGYSATEIAIAIEVVKEMDISSKPH